MADVAMFQRLSKLNKLVMRKGQGFSSECLMEFFRLPTTTHLTYLDLTECQQLDDRGVQAIAFS
jgi:hypothetical protein